MEKGASRVSSDGPQGPRSSGASKITVTRANASTSRQNKHVHHFHFECYFRVCAVFITVPVSHCTYRLLAGVSVHASICRVDNYLQWQWLNQRIIFFPRGQVNQVLSLSLKRLVSMFQSLSFRGEKAPRVNTVATFDRSTAAQPYFQDWWHLRSRWEKYSCHLSNLHALDSAYRATQPWLASGRHDENILQNWTRGGWPGVSQRRYFIIF